MFRTSSGKPAASMPKKPKKQVGPEAHFRCTKAFKKRIKNAAKRHGLNFSAYCRKAMETYLEAQERVSSEDPVPEVVEDLLKQHSEELTES